MFIKGVRKAGPTLTTDTFINAMNLTSFPTDSFGSPRMVYSANRRLGTDASRLSQIQDGRWKVVSDYVTSDPAMTAGVPAKATKTKGSAKASTKVSANTH